MKYFKKIFIFSIFLLSFSIFFFGNNNQALAGTCLDSDIGLTVTPTVIYSPQWVDVNWSNQSGCEYLFVRQENGNWIDVTFGLQYFIDKSQSIEMIGYLPGLLQPPNVVTKIGVVSPSASASIDVIYDRASIDVTVVDENDSPFPGPTWNLLDTPAFGPANPVAGSAPATTHTMAAYTGSWYTITGLPTTYAGKDLASVTNSDGGGTTVYLTYGDAKAINVVYSSASPNPCTINLAGNGSNGPLTVSSGSSVSLTWASTDALSTSGTGFVTGGAISNSSGVNVNPTSNTTYTINGTDALNVVCTDSVVVNVTAPPPIAPTVDLKINGSDGPISITSGSSATLSWTTTNTPTTCTASNGWSGSKSVSGGSQSTGALVSSQMYVISCTNINGTATDQVTVNMGATPAPTVGLSLSPTSVTSGQTTTLTWNVTNATSCTGSGYWSGSKNASGGTEVSFAISSPSTFTLSCTGPGGSNSDTEVVGLIASPPPPTVAISATPLSIIDGQSTNITWTVSDANTCTASTWPYSPNWNGSKSISGGTQSSGALVPNGTYTFTLACTNAQGTDQASVSVNVSPVVPINGTISVNSNVASSWALSPSVVPPTGSGTVGSHVVTPNAGGTIYTITAPAIAGYTQSITSSLNGGPNAGSSATMFPGNNLVYSITYTASGGPFNYSMSATNVSVVQGSSGQSTVTEALLQGATESVTLSVTGLPSGVGVSFANQGCSPGCTAFVNFTVGGSVAPGTYPITISGMSVPTGIAKQTSVNLTVTAPTSFTIDFNPTPTNSSVGQPTMVTPIPSGETPPCTYTWTGTDILPTVAPVLNVTYQTTGVKTITLSAVCNSITRTITKSLVVSINPKYQEF